MAAVLIQLVEPLLHAARGRKHGSRAPGHMVIVEVPARPYTDPPAGSVRVRGSPLCMMTMPDSDHPLRSAPGSRRVGPGTGSRSSRSAGACGRKRSGRGRRRGRSGRCRRRCCSRPSTACTPPGRRARARPACEGCLHALIPGGPVKSLASRAVGVSPMTGTRRLALTEVLVSMQCDGSPSYPQFTGWPRWRAAADSGHARTQQAVAVRADIPEIQATVSAQADSSRSGSIVAVSGSCTRVRRRGPTVARSGVRGTNPSVVVGKGLLEAGRSVACVRIREPLREGRRGKQRSARGIPAERRSLIEPAVASAEDQAAISNPNGCHAKPSRGANASSGVPFS